MQINWRVRLKNPYFWVGVGGLAITALGISPDTLNSWAVVKQQVIEVVNNPYQLGGLIMAVMGAVMDPTTKGWSDSTKAMYYDEPKVDNKTR